MVIPASSPYPAGLQLIHYPHPVLRRRATDVVDFDAPLRDFCQRMFAVMEASNGVGLAAPQVAVGRRVFITDHTRRKEDPAATSDRRVFINPRLEDCQGTTVFEEGCLSFPGIYAKVTRHDRFDIVYQDERGEHRRLHLDVGAGDFLGIVVQHELDHLDGKVFVDHLSAAQIGLIRGRLRDLEHEYRTVTGKTGSIIRR